MKKTIVVAGATGQLGEKITNELLVRGATVHAIARPSTDSVKVKKLENLGVKVFIINTERVDEVARACAGASCVVSALSGLREVVVGTQKVLLDAAVQAGVPRFIPSDYSIDFTKLPVGQNRNLDLRRAFHTYLEKSPIAATTIFNGAFADMLTGQMPLVLFKLKRILYWGNADQRMDFTTMDDTAAFTASAALEDSTPRFLYIAGNQISARELAAVMTDVSGEKFGLLRPGGLGVLDTLIKVARFVEPGEKDLYPAWQGMQYMRNMLEGRVLMQQLDNHRYPTIRWTTAKDVLAAHLAKH
jgi:nucleoside-diphosphate-sugar epimerase